MGRPITVVVTCTDRKRVAPAPGLRVRDLPHGSIADRCDMWVERISAAVDDRVALKDLYMGEAWSMVRALIATASRSGYEPRLLVASAGLGLRPAADTAPSYAATFSRGHADSVGSTVGESRQWWRALRAGSGSRDLVAEAGGAEMLLVLSEAYAVALADDLPRLGAVRGNALLIGGSSAAGGLPRLPADAALRSALGGTATSLSLRMASRWLEQRAGRPIVDDTAMREWQVWAEASRRPERYDRRPASDVEVRGLVRGMLDAEPGLSRTAALRKLRDSGVACEQRRFGSLFRAVACEVSGMVEEVA